MSPASGVTFSLDEGRVETLIAARADRAAYAAGEYLLAAANAHVPLEEGDLERSGAVAVVEGGPGEAVVVVSYDTPYAVAQHEDLTYVHDPGRTAKWLENAMHAEADTMRRIAAGELALP